MSYWCCFFVDNLFTFVLKRWHLLGYKNVLT